MRAQQRQLVWNSLLDADMRARYWGRVARRNERIEMAVTVSIAVFSLAAVGSWMLDSVPQMWQVLSALSAALAIALPILKLGRKAESMADLGARHAILLDSFEQLWRDLPNLPPEEAARRYDALKRQEADLYEPGVRLSESKRLVKKIQREVVRARGQALVA